MATAEPGKAGVAGSLGGMSRRRALQRPAGRQGKPRDRSPVQTPLRAFQGQRSASNWYIGREAKMSTGRRAVMNSDRNKRDRSSVIAGEQESVTDRITELEAAVRALGDALELRLRRRRAPSGAHRSPRPCCSPSAWLDDESPGVRAEGGYASAASSTLPRALRRMTCGGCPNARRKARRIRLRSAKPV
jgi:hypothetical protein